MEIYNSIQISTAQTRSAQLRSLRLGSASYLIHYISSTCFITRAKAQCTRHSFTRFSVNGVRFIFIAVRGVVYHCTLLAGRFSTMRLLHFSAESLTLVDIRSWVFERNQPVAIIFGSESLNKTTYPNRSTVISIDSEGHNRTTFDYSAFVFQRQTGSGGYPAAPRIHAKLPLSKPRL